MKYYCKPNKDEEKEKTINVQLDEFFISFTLPYLYCRLSLKKSH